VCFKGCWHAGNPSLTCGVGSSITAAVVAFISQPRAKSERSRESMRADRLALTVPKRSRGRWRPRVTRDALEHKDAELDARRQKNGDFQHRAHRHECDLLKQKRPDVALLRTVLTKANPPLTQQQEEKDRKQRRGMTCSLKDRRTERRSSASRSSSAHRHGGIRHRTSRCSVSVVGAGSRSARPRFRSGEPSAESILSFVPLLPTICEQVILANDGRPRHQKHRHSHSRPLQPQQPQPHRPRRAIPAPCPARPWRRSCCPTTADESADWS